MTTTVYFVRYGLTQWNVEQKMQGHMDSPLKFHDSHPFIELYGDTSHYEGSADVLLK
ncbi:histidine phosphatase family protein [Paenibacillus lautus]|uniref:histidine phosphatase family protein n=1 Tax=Paenibacillus lautus TaxID=1401 RepID=UPI003D2B06BB